MKLTVENKEVDNNINNNVDHDNRKEDKGKLAMVKRK